MAIVCPLWVSAFLSVSDRDLPYRAEWKRTHVSKMLLGCPLKIPLRQPRTSRDERVCGHVQESQPRAGDCLIQPYSSHASLVCWFIFIWGVGSCCVAQANLELTDSPDPPASASQIQVLQLCLNPPGFFRRSG